MSVYRKIKKELESIQLGRELNSVPIQSETIKRLKELLAPMNLVINDKEITLNEQKKTLELQGFTVIKTEDQNKLFDGDDLLFKKLIKNAQIYGEYGAGMSTKWAIKNSQATVYCVDSDKIWVNKIRSECREAERLNIKYIDIGDIGDWGRPVNYNKRSNYSSYINAWWVKGVKPDLILIDGRFRVGCFLTSLKNAETGTKILFDDYFNRSYYHLVEEFIEPIDKCGRQAYFKIESIQDIDLDKINWTIDRFQFVME